MKYGKRIISMLLAAVMVFSMLPLTAHAAGTLSNFRKVNTYRNGLFNDVSSGAWYADEVRSAYELGLMKGSGGAFSPDSTVTLAETITMAARIHSTYYDGSANFRQSTPWYSVYVDYAKQEGIITQDYANYNAAATRAQFASIFAHALPSSALTGINNVADGAISDVGASHANAQEIYLLYRAGVLTGSNGRFLPASSIRRLEAAAIITRMALPDQRVKSAAETAPAYTWQGDSSLDFTAQMADGSSFTLSAQAGKVVLVNFWATWCGPCVRELPDLNRLYSEYSAGGQVVIVTVNAGESASTVQNFITRQGYDFPVAYDTSRSISNAYNITAIPRTVIFNKDGTVAADLTGSRSYQSFKSAIESALGG